VKKRIGILTSGGDCAGLNAIIRAATYAAKQKGWDMIGIRQGIHGLLMRPLHYVDLDYNFTGLGQVLLRMGGTILGTTNKGNPFSFPLADGTIADLSDAFIEGYHSLKLDALIGIGGDGSLGILSKLAEKGHINFIGIPKTIDNDIGLTDSIGFTTAVNVATEALDRLQPTAASHDRVMILEVMGRGAGHIALHAGIAGGADVILVPEIPFHPEKVIEKIGKVREQGHNFALVVVAEAAASHGSAPSMLVDKTGKKRYGGIGHVLCDYLAERMEAEVRVTVLGHVQRGGQPVSRDRILAACFGVHAIDLIAQGKFNRMVAWQNRSVMDVSLKEALSSYEDVDIHGSMVKTARSLGISFGDDLS
jgi:6-phosphofructokinase 1